MRLDLRKNRPAPATRATSSTGHNNELIQVPTKPSGSHRTIRVTMNNATPRPIRCGPLSPMLANADFDVDDFSNPLIVQSNNRTEATIPQRASAQKGPSDECNTDENRTADEEVVEPRPPMLSLRIKSHAANLTCMRRQGSMRAVAEPVSTDAPS